MTDVVTTNSGTAAAPRAARGRPREFDLDEALDAAIEAFLQHGYHATSLTHLTAATGVHRGSLYAAFGDKHQLFVAALRRHCARSLARMHADVSAGSSALDGIRQHLMRHARLAADQNRGRGCLTANTTLELLPGDTEVAAVIAGHQNAVVAYVAGVIDRARASGEIGGGLPSTQLARYVFTVVEGLWQLGRTTPDEDALTDIAEATLAALRRP
jgi:TetR/AcrR family transcriptional regulator, transcriptional repressor for nem operon